MKKGDLGMSKGVAHDVVLNIGFYNEDKVDPARKDLYLYERAIALKSLKKKKKSPMIGRIGMCY